MEAAIRGNGEKMKPQNMIMINLTEDEAELIKERLERFTCGGVPMDDAIRAVRIFNQIEEQL